MKWYYYLIGALIFTLIISRDKIMSIVTDKITLKRVSDLHPAIIKKVLAFLNEAKKQGINLRVTSGLRTFEEQNDLYNQGRTKEGKIVTNAKGGQSFHNYGLAFDVVPMNNSRPIWDNDDLWERIGKIGKQFGFKWGGDFRSIKDKPHFEYNISLSELQERYAGNDIDLNGYVNLS